MNKLSRLVHKMTGGHLRGSKKLLREKTSPLMKKIHQPFNADDLKKEIESNLPDEWDILFVHSSIDEMNQVFSGEPGEILAMLESLTGEKRTLAMPAFFFGGEDGDMVSWYRNSPVFKSKRTPSQMGLITEFFRRQKGVKRSLHPTHSICAFGPHAEELTRDHHLAGTTFGKNTPYDLMAKYRTKILGIGTFYDQILTQIHHCEDLLGEKFPAPHIMEEIPVKLIDIDKTEHDFVYRKREFEKKKDISLLGKWMGKKMKVWRFHGVPMFLTEAKAVTDTLLTAAERNKTLYSIKID